MYTNKDFLVRVQLDKGRVSDTPESAKTMISDTSWRHSNTINKLTNHTYLSSHMNYQI